MGHMIFVHLNKMRYYFFFNRVNDLDIFVIYSEFCDTTDCLNFIYQTCIWMEEER